MNAVQGPRPLFDSRWMTDAACTRLPGLPWTENRVPRLLVDLMAETCAACPVQEVCEDFVHETRVVAGWWAGSFRSECTDPDTATAVADSHESTDDAA